MSADYLYKGTRVLTAKGRYLPWLNEHALRFLLALPMAGWHVFEWGLGLGTPWWAERVLPGGTVLSIEHDPRWIARMIGELFGNCTVLQRKLVRHHDCPYVQAIDEARGAEYDCIIVDGRNRVLCTVAAIPRVRKGGYLILDNSDRGRYAPAIRAMRAAGMRLVHRSPVVKRVAYQSWETQIWQAA
jgi:predicted O-methyltransferase YrrM